MPEPRRVDATAVANAAGSLLTRIALGVLGGGALGIVTFAILRLTGLLSAGAWPWLIALPLLIAGGMAALTIAGVIRAVRRAASGLLVESGVLRGMVERGLARVRAADERQQAAAAGEAEPPPPRGWLGGKVHAIGDRIARALVPRLRSTAAPEAETAETIDKAASAMIDEWGEMPEYLALGGYVVLVVILALLL